jgi:formamidopyrimidine-DNA glycosylase
VLEAEVAPDEIVLGGLPPDEVRSVLVGATVTGVGRRGKYWWLELDRRPWVFGHLGMAGWVREVGADSIRLREHGNAPFEDSDGRPRFLKLAVTSEAGTVVMTDGRRLARLWLAESPEADLRVSALGPDAWRNLPPPKELHARLGSRTAPIKALLLDQALFAGVGNWIADEALYLARIRPSRPACDLALKDWQRLRQAVESVIDLAVEVGADSARYPDDWLFHHRWGGGKGPAEVAGRAIRRETVGGRTTAWVPGWQK